MPYSHDENLEWIKSRYALADPEHTLDIGPGAGKYSDHLRSPKCKWTAVEAWGPYITEFNLWAKYDMVIVADFQHFDLATIYIPDLVIIGDMLEHLDDTAAQIQINRIKDWTDNIIVSIPLGDYPQEAYQGNWFERHKSTWTHEKVMDLLGDGTSHQLGEVTGAYHWQYV